MGTANNQVNIKSPLNFVSFNARGLGNNVKLGNLFHWLTKYHEIQGKIVFLQETHVIKAREYKWKNIWQGKPFFANGTSNSRGVAILLPKSLDYTLHDVKIDPNGRYIAIKLEFEESIYGIINGYAPTANDLEGQLAWLKQIVEIIEDYGDTNLIFGGDINEGLTGLDKFVKLDKWKPNEYVLAWKEACHEFQLTDIWRVLNPYAHKYTWKQGTNKKNLRRSRLDFWIVSSSIMYKVDNTSIVPGYGSDHSMITLSLYKETKADQGPSFWKFNTSLLREKNVYRQGHNRNR
jgi:exonuclease III